MRKIIIYIILIFSFSFVNGQTIYLTQYSSFCESDIVLDGKQVQERIKSIYKKNYRWRIEFVVIGDCSKEFYPKFELKSDTLYIQTVSVKYKKIILENNDTIIDFKNPEECFCAYDFKLEFNTDTIRVLKINNKIMPITNEKFKTFPVKYFINNNDTTGFVDKYGLRQGILIFNRSETTLKNYYLDNEVIKFELFDLNNKLLIESENQDDYFDYIHNKQTPGNKN